jgi:hypothetical protein
MKTPRNEATAAEEADKLRVKQGLEEDDDEPADGIGGAAAVEEHQTEDEPGCAMAAGADNLPLNRPGYPFSIGGERGK